MGILPLQVGKRKYSFELDTHISGRKTELPVEDLNAIFIETGSENVPLRL